MIEQGIVNEIKNGKAVIKISYNEECSKCGMCLKKDKFMLLTVDNDFNANVGDKVKVERLKEIKFKAIILTFLIPLVLIILGVFIGVLLENELISLALGVVFCALWYLILAFIDKKLSKSKNYSLKMVEVIRSKEDDKGNIE